MASPKKLFAKLNISIKTHFVSYTFYVTFAVILLIYFLHMHAFFLFHIFFKVLKSNVHRIFFLCIHIECLIYIFLGLGGYGEGSEFREVFSSVFGREGGTAFWFLHSYCDTFHVSGFCSNPTQERD